MTPISVNDIRIAHLADIHVKDRRRDEYAAVFTRLAASLAEAQPDVIAIAGDVFDSMTRASTNNVMDVAALLESLSAIAPVAIIPGNHDVNMYSDEKAALLDTVLKAGGGARRLGRVHYWPSSGVHRLDCGGRPVVWVAAPPKDSLPELKDVRDALAECSPGAAVVGLFHETVGGACFDNGMRAAEVEGGGGSTPLSKGYMAALAAVAAEALAPCAMLLGDIHLRQEVPFTGSGAAAAAWYPGSLVCQGFGEHHRGHGWLQWDLGTDSVSVLPVEIPNPRSHLTISLENGADVTAQPLPANPQAVRLRHCEATTPDQIREAVVAAEARYGMSLRSVGPARTASGVRTPRAAPDQKGLEAANRAADSWERHAAFIREKLASDVAAERLTPGTVETVVDRHRANVERLLGGERRRPRVEVQRLEFDNLYCYGEGNVVDFAALREGRPGLAGLVAPNRAGKSALFDILAFALCDAPSRGSKPDLTRRGAEGYSLKLEFTLDGVAGRIEKSGRGQLARGRHTIRYWSGGVELTESTTPKTAQLIRSHVGTLADIETTVLVRPVSVTGRQPFAAQSPEARRSTISGLLRLGVFADLKKHVDAEASELRAEFRGATAAFRGLTAKKQAPHALLESITRHVAGLTSAARTAETAANNAAEAKAAAHASRVAAEQAAARACANRTLAEATVGELADGVPVTAEALETWRDGVVVATSIGDVESARTQLAVARQTAANASQSRATHQAQRKSYVDLWESAGKPAALSESEVVALEAAAAADPPDRWLDDRSRAATRLKNMRVVDAKDALTDARTAATTKTAAIAAAPEPASVDQAKFEKVLRISTPEDELAEMQKRLAELTAKARTVFVQETPVSPLEAAQASERMQVLASRRFQLKQLAANAGIVGKTAADHKRAKCSSGDLDRLLQELMVDLAAHARKHNETSAHQAVRARVLRITQDTRGACRGCQQVTRYVSENVARVIKSDADKIGARYNDALLVLDANVAHLKATVEDGTSEAERLEAATELTAAKTKVDMALKVAAALASCRAKIAKHAEWHAARAAMKQLAAAEESYETAIAHQRELVRAERGLATARATENAAAVARAAYVCCADSDDVNSEIVTLESALDATVQGFRRTRLKFQAGAAIEAREVAKVAESALNTATAALASAEAKWCAASEAAHAVRAEIAQLNVSVDAVRLLVARLDAAEAYRRVLDPRNGLGALLLEEARPAINGAINQALSGLAASFHVVVAPGFDLELVDNATKAVTVPALGSGYQQFALDLAARIALASVAQVPLPACFLIDEGFGCLDAANLARVGEALAAMASAPGAPLTLAVTHRDDLRCHFVHLVTIAAPAGEPSKVVWPPHAGPELDLALPRCDLLDPPRLSGATSNDPHFCTVCDTQVSPSRVAGHAETKSHCRNQRLFDAATAAAESSPHATRVGLKVRCNVCARIFTAKMWPRHATSKRHLKEVS